MTQFEHEADLIVIGSGASGLTGAIVARHHGLKVTLLEKASVFGGTTALSGGVAWLPCNDHLMTAGVGESAELALAYLQGIIGRRTDRAKLESFVSHAPAMLRFMEAHSELRYTPTAMPDYHPSHHGWRAGRSLHVAEYDGRRLGALLGQLRAPLAEMTLFGSLQLQSADVAILRRPFRSPHASRHAVRLISRFLVDLARYGRGTRLVNGNALVARLLKSAVDTGVALQRETSAVRLVIEGGRVRGVVARNRDKELVFVARKGVLLAAGGFGANEARRIACISGSAEWLSLQPAENEGDGIALGEQAGGVVVDTNVLNAILAPISKVPRSDGTEGRLPHVIPDRYMPGSIAVDHRGRRFVCEGGNYIEFVQGILRSGSPKVHLIADRRFVRRYGLGMARPWPFRISPWIRNGYLVEAGTLSGLAECIGVDAPILDDTVKRYNANARLGIDPDFQSGGDAITLYRGDPYNRPNPAIAPIGAGPYYAVPLYPGDLGTVMGLRTDPRARVLDRNDVAIPGLYAAGIDMNSAFEGYYPAAGASLGPALTFAYLAAVEMASS